MRNATMLLAVTTAVLAPAACGHDDMDMMTDHAGELEAHLGAAESEMTDHHARVDAARTLGDAHAEEDAHEGLMADHVGGMMHEMGDMAGCMDGSDDMSAMFADAGRLGAERADHAIRAAEATSLAEARAEEARHHERMSALMAELRDHMQSLMRDMDDMSCPHHE